VCEWYLSILEMDVLLPTTNSVYNCTLKIPAKDSVNDKIVNRHSKTTEAKTKSCGKVSG